MLSAGLTENSASALVRSRPLTDLRRWPGDGFFGQKKRVHPPYLKNKIERGGYVNKIKCFWA